MEFSIYIIQFELKNLRFYNKIIILRISKKMKKKCVLSCLIIISILYACTSIKTTEISVQPDSFQHNPIIEEETIITKEISVIVDNPDEELLKEEEDNTEVLIKQYEALMSSVSLSPSVLPSPSIKGSSFKKPFSILVSYTDNSPAKQFPITIEYPQSIHEGKISFAKAAYLSNDEGLVEFESPPTSFSCNSVISFYPTPEIDIPETQIIIQRIALRIPYLVKTNLSSAGGAIALVDYDKQGKLITNNGITSSALLGNLIRSGFSKIGNAEFFKEIDSGDFNALYNSAKSLYGSQISYLIVGTVKYSEEPQKNEEGFTVSLIADITCLDMQTNVVLYKTSVQTSSTGKTEQSALNSARNEQLAPMLAEKIIYGM